MAELAPAILTGDLSDFRKQYSELFALSHHFKQLHIDFIDGEYLPHKTLEVGSLDFFQSPFSLTAHFMTFDPKQYFAAAKRVGFGTVLVQFDAFENEEEVNASIVEAHKLNLHIGLVINPEVKLFEAAKYLDKVNLVQLMGIHPGAQGREFKKETIEKIKELKKLKKNAIIAVDGGVKVGIARKCVEAGADIIVAGSAIAKSANKKQTIEELIKDIS
ncbi:MAG: hypothetical protein HYW51_02965 [Candidatus Doudnabacteria bacterium]|nr:hypothetical protein [Candidatus Doudnabacteria bacterium]